MELAEDESVASLVRNDWQRDVTLEEKFISGIFVLRRAFYSER